MPVPILRVDDRAVTQRLQKLAKRGRDLHQPLREIGEMVESSVQHNFQVQGRFSSAFDWRGGSTRWKDLSGVTKGLRAKRGHWPGKILQESGSLASSITAQVSGNTVAVGTNKVYAAIHQFGGQAGRGRKVTIPARPYLVLQEEDVQEAIDILDQHLMAP